MKNLLLNGMNSKDKIKVLILIIMSNIFLLCIIPKPQSIVAQSPQVPTDFVTVKVKAKLHTPFVPNKKILVQLSGQLIEAYLIDQRDSNESYFNQSNGNEVTLAVSHIHVFKVTQGSVHIYPLGSKLKMPTQKEFSYDLSF